MAIRVTAADVNKIDGIAVADGDIFISLANLIVNEELVDKMSTQFSADRLKEIERWLAAHFYTVAQNMTAKTERAGRVSITVEGLTGEGIGSTRHGQQAMVVAGGKLTSLHKSNRNVKISPLIGNQPNP